MTLTLAKGRIALSACVLFAVAMLTLAGCGGSLVQTTRLTSDAYPATDPAKVELFTQPPARAYIEIGTLTVTDIPEVDRALAESNLKSAAAKIGADAVVIEQVHHFTAGKGDALPRIDISAVAVKYE